MNIVRTSLAYLGNSSGMSFTKSTKGWTFVENLIIMMTTLYNMQIIALEKFKFKNKTQPKHMMIILSISEKV